MALDIRPLLKALTHVKAHYRTVNGKVVYIPDHDANRQDGSTAATLSQRTVIGKHKSGTHYLRATDAEDGQKIQQAAKELGIDVTRRRAGATHHGRTGSYDHFHVADPSHAGAIHNRLRELEGKDAEPVTMREATPEKGFKIPEKPASFDQKAQALEPKPSAAAPHGFIVESDDFGDDWPMFKTEAEAKAWIKEQSLEVAERSCDENGVGLYGPFKGKSKASIAKIIEKRNQDAITVSRHPGIRVSEHDDKQGGTFKVVHGIAENSEAKNETGVEPKEMKWSYPTDDELMNEVKTEYWIQELLDPNNISPSSLSDERLKSKVETLKEVAHAEPIDPTKVKFRGNWNNYEELKSRTTQIHKDPDSMLEKIKSGQPLPMPIAVRHTDGSIEILGGATRTGLAKLHGSQVTALVIDEKKQHEAFADSYLKDAKESAETWDQTHLFEPIKAYYLENGPKPTVKDEGEARAAFHIAMDLRRVAKMKGIDINGKDKKFEVSAEPAQPKEGLAAQGAHDHVEGLKRQILYNQKAHGFKNPHAATALQDTEFGDHKHARESHEIAAGWHSQEAKKARAEGRNDGTAEGHEGSMQAHDALAKWHGEQHKAESVEANHRLAESNKDRSKTKFNTHPAYSRPGKNGPTFHSYENDQELPDYEGPYHPNGFTSQTEHTWKDGDKRQTSSNPKPQTQKAPPSLDGQAPTKSGPLGDKARELAKMSRNHTDGTKGEKFERTSKAAHPYSQSAHLASVQAHTPEGHAAAAEKHKAAARAHEIAAEDVRKLYPRGARAEADHHGLKNGHLDLAKEHEALAKNGGDTSANQQRTPQDSTEYAGDMTAKANQAGAEAEKNAKRNPEEAKTHHSAAATAHTSAAAAHIKAAETHEGQARLHGSDPKKSEKARDHREAATLHEQKAKFHTEQAGKGKAEAEAPKAEEKPAEAAPTKTMHEALNHADKLHRGLEMGGGTANTAEARREAAKAHDEAIKHLEEAAQHHKGTKTGRDIETTLQQFKSRRDWHNYVADKQEAARNAPKKGRGLKKSFEEGSDYLSFADWKAENGRKESPKA